MKPDASAAQLHKTLNVRATTTKGHFVSEVSSAAHPLLVWLQFLRTTISRKIADSLLDAVQASMIEVAASLTLGLVRPAIFSMRVQHELLLAWVYYNDHHVEWGHRERTNEEFITRAVAIKFLRDNDRRFDERFKLLQSKKKRPMDDPYGLLSIHVHTTSHYAAPSVGPLESVVKSLSDCEECVELQKSVAEYLCDVLAAWYASRWHDFPTEISNAIKSRLNTKDLKDFAKA